MAYRHSPAWLPLLLMSLVSLLTLTCATVRSSFNYAAEPDPRKQEYELGPADIVRVTVWHNAELSGDAIVRPDGTITLPLIGDLRAAGRTPPQLRAEIAERLKTFVKDEAAIVTVAVSTVNSYRFTVAGHVERQGAYTSTHYVTVSEAIVLAGGPNRYANPEQIVIIRADKKAGKPRRIPIDYPRILTGQFPEQDIPVTTGDIVYVP